MQRMSWEVKSVELECRIQLKVTQNLRLRNIFLWNDLRNAMHKIDWIEWAAKKDTQQTAVAENEMYVTRYLV